VNRTNKTPGRKRGEITLRREAGSSVVDLRSWVSDYVRAVATYGTTSGQSQSVDIQPVRHLPKAS
jgi:hypothetical protein